MPIADVIEGTASNIQKTLNGTCYNLTFLMGVRFCNFQTEKEILLDGHSNWLCNNIIKAKLNCRGRLYFNLIGHASERWEHTKGNDPRHLNKVLSQKRINKVKETINKYKTNQDFIFEENNMGDDELVGLNERGAKKDPNDPYYRAVEVYIFDATVAPSSPGPSPPPTPIPVRRLRFAIRIISSFELTAGAVIGGGVFWGKFRIYDLQDKKRADFVFGAPVVLGGVDLKLKGLLDLLSKVPNYQPNMGDVNYFGIETTGGYMPLHHFQRFFGVSYNDGPGVSIILGSLQSYSVLGFDPDLKDDRGNVVKIRDRNGERTLKWIPFEGGWDWGLGIGITIQTVRMGYFIQEGGITSFNDTELHNQAHEPHKIRLTPEQERALIAEQGETGEMGGHQGRGNI